MREETESKLAELLFTCYRGENVVESFRKTLCEAFDFSLRHFFSLITTGSYINSRELQNFLKAHGLNSTSDEIFMVIKQFSNLQDGRLSFDDFEQICLPSADLSLRRRVKDRGIIRNFDKATLDKFIKVFAEEINYQVQLEETKQMVYGQKDFTVYAGYEVLARGKSWVAEEDLTLFLKRFNKGFSLDDYESFLRRTDLEGDGVINYNEFLDFVMPFNVPSKTEESKASDLSQSKVESNPEEKTPEGKVKKTLNNSKSDEKSQKTEEKSEVHKEKSEEKKENKEKSEEKKENKEEKKEKSEEIEQSKESNEENENNLLANELLDLLLAVKIEETHKQNLAVFGEIPAETVLKVVNTEDYHENFKKNFQQESKQKLCDTIFQILAPIDTEYQLNIVVDGQGLASTLEKLVKLACDSFIRVQDLIFQVMDRFKQSAQSDENFDSKVIISKLALIQVYLVERDLNLLLNRLDLTD